MSSIKVKLVLRTANKEYDIPNGCWFRINKDDDDSVYFREAYGTYYQLPPDGVLSELESNEIKDMYVSLEKNSADLLKFQSIKFRQIIEE